LKRVSGGKCGAFGRVEKEEETEVRL